MDIFTKKIILAFVAMIVFMLFAGTYGINKVQQLQRNTTQLYLHPYTVSNAVRDIEIHIISIHRSMKDITSAPFDQHAKLLVKNINRQEQQALQQFDIVLDRFLGDKSRISAARKAFVDWKIIRTKVIALTQEGRNSEALRITKGKGAIRVDFLNRMMEDFAAYASKKGIAFYAAAQQSGEQSLLSLKLLLLMVLLVTISVFVFIIRLQKKTQLDTQRHIDCIKQNENKYRELLNASPDAVIIINQERIIQIVNTQAITLFGYAAEEMIGKSIELLIAKPFVNKHPDLVKQFFKNPQARPINKGRRLQALLKNGSEIPVSISLNPVTIDGQQLVTSDIRDMREQESIEIQFRQAQKMEAIGTLVGGIAHDFNNMLASISGSTYMAKQKLNAPDNKYLNRIETETHQAGKIVQHLLAFARKGVVQKKYIDLAELLDDSANMLRMAATERVQVNIDCDHGKLIINGDYSQLQQVVMNLVNNARDALHDHPTPVISVSADAFSTDKDFQDKHPSAVNASFARLCVADNGPGISEQNLKKIFEPFFTTKETGKGTGLGLAMIDGTIASHNGFIDVETHADQGTAFMIYLPLIENGIAVDAEDDTSNQTSSILEGKGQCVLLVDDETVLRETNCSVLESIGYQVVEAGDGLQAIEQFRKHQNMIKLVLMDVVMPKMGGIDATKRIRAMAPSIPVIFMTGYDRSQVLGDELTDLKDCAVLTKPFTVVALSKEVDHAIHQG
ncbi:MAG: PAS domain S-box protein [Mariprofundaceae bacterium]|nr:PAS domain S-box protein [Mariprofundaceae bacterium]